MTNSLTDLEKMYNKYGVIYKIKEKWGIGKIKKNFSKLANDKKYKDIVLPSLFPKEASIISKPIYMQELPLSNQMIWAANVIYFYRKEINMFISLKNKFENNLLFSEYEEAIEILEKIKKKFGVSYWYYYSKLLVYEYKNIEKYDESIVKGIYEEFDNNIIGKVIIEQFDERLKINVSYNQFKKNIMEIAKSIEELKEYNKNLFKYIIYKIDPFNICTESDLSNALNLDSYASLIDYYLTFKDILVKMSSKLECEETKILIKDLVKILDGGINDEVIDCIEIIIGYRKINTIKNKCENIDLDILEFYTIGQYEKCLSLCEEAILKKHISNELLEIYTKCVIKSNENFNYRLLNNTVLKIYFVQRAELESRKGNIQHILNLFTKFALDFSSTQFGMHIKSLLVNKYQLKELTNTKFNSQIVNFCLCNPNLYAQIPDEKKKLDSINILSKMYSESKTIQLYKAIWNKDIETLKNLNLPVERYMKYYSMVLIEKCNYEQAITILKNLELKCNIAELNQIITSLIQCYIELNQIEQCIELVVKYSLKNMNLCFNIPLMDIVNKADDQLDCYLNLAIFYSLCIKNIDNIEEFVEDINERLFDEYENYLDSINLKKPSELFDIDMNELILFFLENVCTIKVMYNSKEFNESAEIEEERGRILNFLIKYHSKPNNLIDRYINELSSISENKLLRKSVNEIGKNKILINLDQIKIEANKKVKEKFFTYISNLDNIPKNVEYLMQDISIDESDEKVIGHIPKNNNVMLFYTLIFEVRDIFTTQLDCCLGADIRHGRLVSQLRVPFEKEHLLTTKNRDTDEYIINEYWIKKYSSLSENEANLINKSLTNFTKKLNALFKDVKDIWIQIRKESGDVKKLFDFSFEVDTLEEMMKQVTLNTSFDEFIDYVLEVLWEKTNINLHIVREKITKDLNEIIDEECIELLKKLSLDISQESQNSCKELFNNIKRAKTESQYNLQTVSEWFNFSNEIEGKAYHIDHAVNVALGILSEMHPNSIINIRSDIVDDIILARRTLKYFVNIFFIILENSIKHKKNNEINIELFILKKDEHGVLIKFVNKVGSLASDKDIENVKRINEKLKREVTNDDVIKEGGTGFLKIRKIIIIDLAYRISNIELRYEDSEFIAEIFFER